MNLTIFFKIYLFFWFLNLDMKIAAHFLCISTMPFAWRSLQTNGHSQRLSSFQSTWRTNFKYKIFISDLFWLSVLKFSTSNSTVHGLNFTLVSMEQYRTQASEAAWMSLWIWSFLLDPWRLNSGVRRVLRWLRFFYDQFPWRLRANTWFVRVFLLIMWCAPFWCRWSGFCPNYQ